MRTVINWIVCERTGQWSAALRTAIARRPFAFNAIAPEPRIQELRDLAELHPAIEANAPALGLIEVRTDNLATILELLAKDWRRNIRHVILLDADVSLTPTADRTLTADTLREVGALAVIDSPRDVSTILDLTERIAASRSRTCPPAGESNTLAAIADQARASLPWQDA